jgi:hypothetical protein
MTIQHSGSTNSTTNSYTEESAPMNLDTLARLETQAREAELRHHLDERVLERAADRQRHRPTASGADGPGWLSRLVGRLAPRRVANANLVATDDAQEPAVVAKAAAGQASCLDCDTATAGNRAA